MPARTRTVDELTCANCGIVFPYKHSGGKANRFCGRSCAYSRTPEQRFWGKVTKDGPIPDTCPDLGPCWCWLGSLFTDSGYGQFWMDGTNRRAHIVSYEWANGPTNGAQVQHLCNVRVCVRPSHLTLGTPAENIAYAVETGSNAYGSRHGRTTLTEDDVRLIRRLVSEGTPQITLARQYGLSKSAMSGLVTRLTWKHVT